MTSAVKKGYLIKQGGSVKSWKKRWFTLVESPPVLSYFKDEQETELLGTIELLTATAVVEAENNGKKTAVSISTPNRNYIVVAETEALRDDWYNAMVSALRKSTNASQFAEDSKAVEKGETPKTDGDTVKSGFLVKQGGSNKNWKKRHFQLKENGSLWYYKDFKINQVAAGVIELAAATSIQAADEAKHGRPFVIEVVTPARTFTLGASSDSERREWILALQDLIPESPNASGASNIPTLGLRSGYLAKLAGKIWRKRWFVLKENAVLEVYRDHKDLSSLLLQLNLQDSGSVKSGDQPVHQQSFVFEISFPGHSIEIACSNQAERDEWVNIFAKTILESAEAGETASPAENNDEERTVEPPPSSATVVKTGYLVKQGGSNKTWKKRWFTITDDKRLNYYKDEKSSNPVDRIDLSVASQIRPAADQKDQKKPSFFFEIVTSERTYLIQASSEADRDEWLEACQKVVPEKVSRSAATPAEKDDGKAPKRKEREGTFFSKLIASATGSDKDKTPLGKDGKPLPQVDAQVKKDEEFVNVTAERLADYDDDEDEINVSDGPQPIEAVKNADKVGYLSKTGGKNRNFRKRFFVLKGTNLWYYKSTKDKKPVGLIDLRKCKGLRFDSERKTEKRAHILEIITEGRTYVLSAATAEYLEIWIEALSDAVPDESNDAAANGASEQSKSGEAGAVAGGRD